MNWAYIAGFFDGEGHNCLTQTTLQVGMSQQNIDVLEKIKEFLASQSIKSRIYRLGNTKNHALVICTVPCCLKFLDSIFPFLIVKKTKAQDVLRYYTLWPQLRTTKFERLTKKRLAAITATM